MVWLLCAAAPPAVSAERILPQRTAPTFTLQKIAFPVLMFSRQYAIGWARLFLASNRHLKLTHATLIPDGPPANLSRVGCATAIPIVGGEASGMSSLPQLLGRRGIDAMAPLTGSGERWGDGAGVGDGWGLGDAVAAVAVSTGCETEPIPWFGSCSEGDTRRRLRSRARRARWKSCSIWAR